MTLLRRNAELARINVWNWTLPAWVVRRDDGTHYNVCPSAGACAKVCYARNGTYLFPKVRASHLRNLEASLVTVLGAGDWTGVAQTLYDDPLL